MFPRDHQWMKPAQRFRLGCRRQLLRPGPIRE
jgi:hypothetical protein